MKKLLFMLGVSAFIGCGPSTTIQKSWREPGSTISASAGGTEKVLVLGVVKDESSRRIVEDNLVKKLNGRGVASYTVLTEDMLKAAKDEVLDQKLKEGGFTHVLMMRLAEMEKETSYVPGSTYYGGYGGYRGGYYGGMYGSSGYYQEDKNYYVETAIYSISPNKLLWTGTTKTVNPTKLGNTIDDIALVVSEQMKKDGFLIK